MLISTLEDFEAVVTRAYEAALTYYHSADESPLEDAEYDALISTLEETVEQNPLWGRYSATYQSLIHDVAGGTSVPGDIKHSTPMLSLKKVKYDDVLAGTMRAVSKEVIIEPKLDGSAIAAQYVDGILMQAATRGDGYEGTDVTEKLVHHVVGLPAKLSRPFTGEVRGEVYMTTTQFNTASDARRDLAHAEWKQSAAKAKEAGRTPKAWKPEDFTFSNSRNAVSGLINRDGIAPFAYSLSFAAYDVIADTNTDSGLDNMLRLEALDIKPAVLLLDKRFHSPITDVATVEALITDINDKRSTFPFPIDGAVIKAVSLSERTRLGIGSRHPNWAIACKYDPDAGVSQVQEILTSVGSTGRLALRARITPVQVGTLITYVSLHNVDWLTKKDIRVGDTVLVSRRNDVIPQIESTISRPQDSKPWVAPQVCPQCGEVWNKDTLLWRCETPECSALNKILRAAGREFFDWDGMSTAIITQLFETELIENIADVFAVTQDQFANLVMRVTDAGSDVLLGEKNAKKVYDRIQKSKDTPLAKVVASLGIRTLGRTFGRRLAAHFGNMSAIRAASTTELQQVEGIKDKALVIHEGLRDASDIIEALDAHGVNMVAEKKASTGNNAVLAGKNVCVTGSMSGSALDGLTRPQVQELVESHGGRASSSVSSTTSILVAAGTASSKYKKAVSLGSVEILSPSDFAVLLGM